MTDDTLHPPAQPLAPTTGLLTRALDSLRAFATDTDRSEYLTAFVARVGRFAIQHIVETLRQAGLADEARRILAGELEDLHVLKATSEGPYAVETEAIGVSRDVVDICEKAFARPARDPGNLKVIQGGRGSAPSGRLAERESEGANNGARR